MGASETACGLISSLPSMCALAILLPAAFLGERVSDRRRNLALCIMLCALLMIPLAMSPWFGAYRYWFFIGGLCLWYLPYVCYTMLWQSYFYDLFPPENRAVPYARRMAVNNILPAAVLLASSLILTYLCRSPAQKTTAYQLFWLLAMVFTFFQALMIYRTTPANTPATVKKEPFSRIYAEAFLQLKITPALRNSSGLFFFCISAGRWRGRFSTYSVWAICK